MGRARHRRDRAIVLAVGIACVLACKEERKATTAPSHGTKPGAVDVAYRPSRLRADVSVELTSNGGGRYVEAAAKMSVAVDVKVQGEALAFAWTIERVDDLSLQGTIPKGDVDLADYLVKHGRGAWVLDAKGNEDIAATDEHAANRDRRSLIAADAARLAEAKTTGAKADAHPGVTLLELLPPMLVPPRLPDGTLAIGKSVEATTTSELELEGLGVVLPIETTRKTTLVGVDESGAARLAELQLDVQRFGGVDTETGAIELEEHAEGTLLFDLDHGAPVRLELDATESFTAGERGGDTTKIVRAEFERL